MKELQHVKDRIYLAQSYQNMYACAYVYVLMYPWCSLCVNIPRFYPHGLQSSGKPLTYCVSFPLKIFKLADLFSAVYHHGTRASLH